MRRSDIEKQRAAGQQALEEAQRRGVQVGNPTDPQ
jgi:hypothetical protein